MNKTKAERSIFEHDYVKVWASDSYINVSFYIEEDEPFRIGERMNEINEHAYMNGYNWEALIEFYLKNNAPDIYDDVFSDPEAGLYAAYFKDSKENEDKAVRLAKIILSLIDNEEELYRMVREEGNKISWDIYAENETDEYQTPVETNGLKRVWEHLKRLLHI